MAKKINRNDEIFIWKKEKLLLNYFFNLTLFESYFKI